MANSTKKVVGISNWYFFFEILLKLSIFVLLFLLFYIVSIMTTGKDNPSPMWSLILSGTISLILLIGNILYWRQSGIYISEKGDHIVKMGGWTVKESTLLNGTIIANQITRGPIDQLFGLGNIQTGLFGDKKLVGIRYKDIQHYDDLMRNNGFQSNSMF